MVIMETTTAPKRTYQKHKTEGKITVKHYLDVRLKPSIHEEKEYYPVYVRVMTKGQTANFKSTTNIITTQNDFDNEFWNDEAKKALQKEVENIITIVKDLKPFERTDFKITELTELYTNLSKPFFDILDLRFREFLKLKFEDYFNQKYSKEVDENALLIRNVVLSGVNWQSKSGLIFKLLESYVPDYTNYVKGFFYTSYLWDTMRIKIAFLQKVAPHTLLDFTQGNFQADIIEKLGLEDGKAYITDIMKVLDFHINSKFSIQIFV